MTEAVQASLRTNQALLLAGVLIMLDEAENLEDAKRRLKDAILALTS